MRFLIEGSAASRSPEKKNLRFQQDIHIDTSYQESEEDVSEDVEDEESSNFSDDVEIEYEDTTQVSKVKSFSKFDKLVSHI